MDNAIFSFPKPINEPVKAYAPGSSEKSSLKKALAQLSSEEWDIPLVIGGKEIRTGNTGKVVMPHDHHHVLATYHKAGEKEVQMAIDAAMKAHKEWSELPWVERASVMLRVAELLSTKYRYILNASVMLGQSKNPFQAEIDAPCELIDFLRFSTFYASQVYADQPYSETGILNRMEYRALEGFVFSLTPFNFTSIASNLNMAPAMMGNVAVWKPSTTAIHSNYFLMKVFREAGLPDGVVNFIPGQGSVIGKVITASRDLGGFHFTGSTSTFNTLWRQIGENLGHYKSYPKIVGETGGKNFIFVHPSAPALEVATAIVRGAFEYQGQKCSAGSRAYIPASLWKEVKDYVGDMLKEIKMGDVQDFTNFVNAVIDEASFDNIMSYIDYAKQSPDAEIVFGGNGDKSVGYFVEPTVIRTTDPMFKSMVEEIFGPVITIYVYDDNKYEETLELCDRTSPYGLTGSIFARDRYAIDMAFNKLRYAAGNFYINDMPNLTPKSKDEITQLVSDAVKQIRATHSSPILLVEHAGYSNAPADDTKLQDYTRMNEGAKKAFEELQAQGIKDIYYLTREELGPHPDAWVDYVHPSDWGMETQANAVERKVREILRIPEGDLSTTKPVTQRREPNNYEWQKRHRDILSLNQSNPPRRVILGNSITHFWGGEPKGPSVRGLETWEKIMRPAGFHNLGYGFDRIENVLWRVYHGELDGYKAEEVVLMIGTNNIGINNDNEIVEGIRFLLSAIRQRQPEAKIKVIGILPRRNQEERVRNLNLRIRQIAETGWYTFKNPGTKLLQEDGKINESLFSDGLHPNEEGYKQIVDEIAH